MNTIPTDQPTPDGRYDRQSRFRMIGAAGQQRIEAGRVLICGCGALGSVIANTLARAGVGFLRIADRDLVELSNLQRQVLFDEQDAAQHVPKAIAARDRLAEINSTVTVDARVVDVNHTTIEELLDGIHLIVDGTDNFETRFLLNDAAHKFDLPWIYGGCIGSEGQSMTVIPGVTPCFRCLVSEPPPPGSTPTCDTAGIIGPIVNVIASIQSAEALKLLSGDTTNFQRGLTIIDLWSGPMRSIDLSKLLENRCPTCNNGETPWLSGDRSSQSAVMCGRNAVQLTFAQSQHVSLADLAKKLMAVGKVQETPFYVRAEIDRFTLTLFPDGRAVIGGTNDAARARTVYARYVGH